MLKTVEFYLIKIAVQNYSLIFHFLNFIDIDI